VAEIGLFAVILDQQRRVLLCHRRDDDLWNLPGGRMERDESPWQGVIREVKEEVGLDVAVVRLVGVYSRPEKDEIVFCFLCEVIGGDIATSDEADQVEYFEFQTIPQTTLPSHVERISDALDGQREAVLNVQRGGSARPSHGVTAGEP